MSDEQFKHIDERFNKLTGLVEHLGTQIKIVAEGYVMTNERIDRMQAAIDKRFDEMDAKLTFFAANVNNRFDTLEASLNDTNRRVTHLEVTTDRLKATTDEIKDRVERLEATTDEIKDRVERLEGTTEEIKDRVVRLEAWADDSQPRLQRIEGHLQLQPARGARTPARTRRAAVGKRSRKS